MFILWKLTQGGSSWDTNHPLFGKGHILPPEAMLNTLNVPYCLSTGQVLLPTKSPMTPGWPMGGYLFWGLQRPVPEKSACRSQSCSTWNWRWAKASWMMAPMEFVDPRIKLWSKGVKSTMEDSFIEAASLLCVGGPKATASRPLILGSQVTL